MNIVDLFDEYKVPYKRAGEHAHATGEWVQVDCKQCSPNSGHFRLGFHNSGWCSCWVCGRQWIVKALADVLDVSVTEAKKLLGGIDHAPREEQQPRGKLVLPPGLEPLAGCHKRYLERRGFDPAHLEKFWGVKGIGIASRLAFRLWIPLHLRGEVVSWTTRAITDQPDVTRYVNAKRTEEALPIKSLLLGEDHCRHAVIVVEGPLDAMRVGPGAAATMGVVYSREQVRRIARFPVRAICMDSDKAGQRRAQHLCDELAPFPGKTYCVQLKAKDPGSASAKEIRKLRRAFLGE